MQEAQQEEHAGNGSSGITELDKQKLEAIARVTRQVAEDLKAKYRRYHAQENLETPSEDYIGPQCGQLIIVEDLPLVVQRVTRKKGSKGAAHTQFTVIFKSLTDGELVHYAEMAAEKFVEHSAKVNEKTLAKLNVTSKLADPPPPLKRSFWQRIKARLSK